MSSVRRTFGSQLVSLRAEIGQLLLISVLFLAELGMIEIIPYLVAGEFGDIAKVHGFSDLLF